MVYDDGNINDGNYRAEGTTSYQWSINWWMVFLTILKNMSSSMGRMTSHILWKIKNVWNHQPVKKMGINCTHGLFGSMSTNSKWVSKNGGCPPVAAVWLEDKAIQSVFSTAISSDFGDTPSTVLRSHLYKDMNIHSWTAKSQFDICIHSLNCDWYLGKSGG